MTKDASQTFTATEASKPIFERLFDGVSERGIEQFFNLWEAQGEGSDPREAGSLVAHAYMTIAARIAVFAAECSGNKPRREQWLAMAAEHFDKAIADVDTAFEKTKEEN